MEPARLVAQSKSAQERWMCAGVEYLVSMVFLEHPLQVEWAARDERVEDT